MIHTHRTIISLLLCILIQGVAWAAPDERLSVRLSDISPSGATAFRLHDATSTDEKATPAHERSTVSSDSLVLNVSGEGNHFFLHWIAPRLFSCLEYEVERAWAQDYRITAETRWVRIGDVPGICFVDESIPYSFTDRTSGTLTEGSVQYRLYIKTLDGQEYYSYSEALLVSQPERIRILDVYPQPASQEVTASVVVPSFSGVSYRIFNTLGQVVASVPNAFTGSGLQLVPVGVSGLPSGHYQLEISTGDGVAHTVLRILR
ncbi:MAG: T9SS type A sorting domain-containing protein [Bacteroidetes bacterium]|nr:T9SS type A sorting domain-containing protein [Bacteroidota bacterium]